MKNLTVKKHEYLTLKPLDWGSVGVWCKVWEKGKRNPKKDGYFLTEQLKVKK